LKKQGVILLITLFFISALSVLILKNLDDSEQFIKEVSLDTTLVQLRITRNNIELETKKLIKNYKNNIDKILDITQDGIPMSYEGIDVIIKLERYDTSNCNINDINRSTDINNICGEDINNNINYPYDFKEILETLKPIDTQQKLDYFFNKYTTITYDNDIGKIADQFSYLDTNSSANYLRCNYTIDMLNIEASGYFIFDINNITYDKDAIDKGFWIIK